ncbi:MAG: DUF92 domain-containing protein [Methanomicrobiales archaeon]|nr:DUF92 domain-containing protein [Methanomicrobiales archaeon]
MAEPALSALHVRRDPVTSRDLLPAALAVASILASPHVQPPWVLAVLVIPASLILYLIPATQAFSPAAILVSALYAFGIVPLFVYAVTFAILVCGFLIFRPGREASIACLYYFAAATAGAALVLAYLDVFYPLAALFGVVIAVLLKVLFRGREDGLAVEALGIAMGMYLIHDLHYHVDLPLIALAVAVAFSFGYFSYRFRTADLSGLFSGALVGLILILFTWETYRISWFLVMLAFFVLGSLCTRYKYAYKERLGVEQSHGGARGYRNVFGNGLVSAAAAILYGISGQPLFVAMFVGSVAAAAGDTVASEIGVTGGSPRLITTFRRVPAGTNGGVTLLGEAAAILGAGAISLFAVALGVVDPLTGGICTLAGFAGTNLDSLAGATVENRGLIGNAGSNLIGTLGGGAVALVLVYLHPFAIF